MPLNLCIYLSEQMYSHSFLYLYSLQKVLGREMDPNSTNFREAAVKILHVVIVSEVHLTPPN